MVRAIAETSIKMISLERSKLPKDITTWKGLLKLYESLGTTIDWEYYASHVFIEWKAPSEGVKPGEFFFACEKGIQWQINKSDSSKIYFLLPKLISWEDEDGVHWYNGQDIRP